jgi:hypothetical protein
MNISFSLDSIRITETRALHNDTDFVSVSITVGANPAITQTRAMGDLNNGTYQVSLGVSADIPADDTQVIFTYTIVNNGHTDQSTFEKAVSAALTALGAAGAKAGATELGSILGTATVPFVGSALGALSGWLVGELTSVIFADCDGPVAIGVHIYTGNQLIQTLGASQKIAETNVQHLGSNSSLGCGANSVYFTTDTISATIATEINLNGQWAIGGVPGPVIAVNGNTFTVDMSAYKRPTALGAIVNSSNISVDFPDDKTYSGTLKSPNTIEWSNNSTWTNVAIQPLIDLTGQWAAGGVPGPVISVTGNSISIDMSANKRPTALGSFVTSSSITVNFPDDKTYTGTLQPPNTIHWSNNSAWTKVEGVVVTPLEAHPVNSGDLHNGPDNQLGRR